MADTGKTADRFFSAEKPEPLRYDMAAGDQIFDVVKHAILCMDIPPGTLISEVEVGRRFSASRTPVREAFMKLREAGLVSTLPSRGNFVTKLSSGRIKEARFVRQAIELANVEELCTAGISDEFQREIEGVLNAQLKGVGDGERQKFQQLDDQFHLTLAFATGYTRMAEILEREKMVLDRLRVLSLDDEGHKKRLYNQHKEIYETILKNETLSARALMSDHLVSILETLSSVSGRHESYFE